MGQTSQIGETTRNEGTLDAKTDTEWTQWMPEEVTSTLEAEKMVDDGVVDEMNKRETEKRRNHGNQGHDGGTRSNFGRSC